MPIIDDIDMSEFRRLANMENEAWREWEKNRIIKRCKSCGQPYSFEKGERDPKECQDCRGDTGRLIY